MSFSWIALKRIERLAPELDVVFLMQSTREWLRARPLTRPDWIAGPDIALVREHPKVIARIAERSRVHSWTVNTEADADLCRDLGVEAVITDRPGPMLRYLER
jgi:glycerophosphoryl diester phosphodiesterase